MTDYSAANAAIAALVKAHIQHEESAKRLMSAQRLTKDRLIEARVDEPTVQQILSLAKSGFAIVIDKPESA